MDNDRPKSAKFEKCNVSEWSGAPSFPSLKVRRSFLLARRAHNTLRGMIVRLWLTLRAAKLGTAEAKGLLD